MIEHPGWAVAKPMSFTPAMMRAIFDGRKSDTRRLPKTQPMGGVRPSPFVPSGIEDGHGRQIKVPHPVGSFIYSRERMSGELYEADGHESEGAWKPAFLMPRKFSRALLEVKRARIEKLSLIDSGGAEREGIIMRRSLLGRRYGIPEWPFGEWCECPVQAYFKLWDSIHGKEMPSSSDPFVFVFSFEVVDMRNGAESQRIADLMDAFRASVEAAKKRRGR